MTTIIAVYDRAGNCIGRCDERCYNAIHPYCTCICDGTNHGKGLHHALENNARLVAESPESAIDRPEDTVLEMLLPLPI
jgi:hypothetical protein